MYSASDKYHHEWSQGTQKFNESSTKLEKNQQEFTALKNENEAEGFSKVAKKLGPQHPMYSALLEHAEAERTRVNAKEKQAQVGHLSGLSSGLEQAKKGLTMRKAEDAKMNAIRGGKAKDGHPGRTQDEIKAVEAMQTTYNRYHKQYGD